jgi:hypothetical protein
MSKYVFAEVGRKERDQKYNLQLEIRKLRLHHAKTIGPFTQKLIITFWKNLSI